MKIVVQRVKNAQVEVEGKIVGNIQKGFLVLLGVTHKDTKEEADFLVKKLCNLRVFTLKGCRWRIINSFSIYSICRLYRRK